MALTLMSTAFSDDAPIPAQYACETADIAPSLHWSGAPPASKGIALIVDDSATHDPQAPKVTWVH